MERLQFLCLKVHECMNGCEEGYALNLHLNVSVFLTCLPWIWLSGNWRKSALLMSLSSCRYLQILGACNAPSRFFLPHARRYCLIQLVIFCIKLCFCMVTDMPFQAQECLLSLESYSQMEIQVILLFTSVQFTHSYLGHCWMSSPRLCLLNNLGRCLSSEHIV